MIMEIQEFPIGIKKYQMRAALAKNIVGALDRNLYKGIAKILVTAANVPQGDEQYSSSKVNEIRNAATYQHQFQMKEDKDIPVYTTMGENSFTHLNSPRCNSNDGIYTNQVAKASSYQRTGQYPMLGNLPAIKGMDFSVKGTELTVYNTPYEGPLKNSARFKEVNKLITTKMKELKAKIEITCMISEGYMEIPENVGKSWCSKQLTTEELVPYFIRYMDGTSTLDDELLLANRVGILSSEYRDHSKSDFTRVYKVSNNKPKFPTGIRTRLYYMMGALEVDGNAEEWFDE